MNLNVVLSAGDLTFLRTKRYSTKMYMSFVPMTSFATALVNQVVFDNPLSQLTVDTTSANWLNVRTGMTVFIGSTAGAYDYGIYRVRKAPTSTILYLMELSVGDPGRVLTDTLKYMTDNAFITVVLDYNAWSVFPRITFSGGIGTFYKDYEVAYTTQNETTVPVALNLGEHKAGFVTAGTLSHTFTATYEAFDSTTITNYQFFVDEVSQQSGASASFTYSYATGHHIMRCVATLSTGATVEGERNVWAHDTGSYPPVSITISSDRRTRKGRSFDVQLEQGFDTTLLKGAMICIWEVPTWEGGTPIDSAVTSCIGFVETIDGSAEANAEGFRRDIRLSIISPLEMMGRLVSFEQLIRVTSNPTNWQEILAALSHPDFFAFYILYWHSTLLRLVDFHKGGFSGYQANSWKTDSGDMVAQINRQLDSINAELTCDGTGSGLWIRRDPVMLEVTPRASVVNRQTMTSADGELVSYQRRVNPEVSKVDAYGFVTSTSAQPTAIHVQSTSSTDGQGGDQARLEGQIVLDSTNDLRYRASNYFIKQNNPIPRLTWRCAHGVDVYEPSQRYFVTLNIPASKWPEGVVLNKRFTIEEVNISYEGDGTRTITLSLSLETNGAGTGGEIIPLRGGNGIADVDISIPTYDNLSGVPVPEYDPFYAGTGISIGDLILPPPQKVEDEGLPGTALPSSILILSRDRQFVDGSTTLHEGEIHTINSPTLVPFSSLKIDTLPSIRPPGSPINSYSEDVEILGSPPLEGPIPILYVAQAYGVYTIADALNPEATPELKINNTGYNELRVVPGSSSQFVIASHVWGKFYKEYNFITSSHSSDGWSIVNPGGGNPTLGQYTGGSGYTDTRVNQYRGVNRLQVDWSNVCLIHKIEVEYSITAGTGFVANLCKLSSQFAGVLANFSAGSNQTLAWTPTAPYYHIADDKLFIDILCGNSGDPGIDPGGSVVVKKVRIWGGGFNAGIAPLNVTPKVYYGYSATLGSSLTEHIVDDWDGTLGLDIDKFNLGCAVIAANKKLYRVSGGYGNAPIEITATLSGIDKIANKPSFIHIPKKKLATQVDNNDPTSLMVLYGVSTLVGVESAWATNINMLTGAVGVTSNITPTISGTRYFVQSSAGGRALATCDENTQKILCTTNHGNDALYSSDGGTTWVVITNPATGSASVNQIRYQPGTNAVFWRFYVGGSQRVIDNVGQTADTSLSRGRAGALL